jgi:hypothetical protein
MMPFQNNSLSNQIPLEARRLAFTVGVGPFKEAHVQGKKVMVGKIRHANAL